MGVPVWIVIGLLILMLVGACQIAWWLASLVMAVWDYFYKLRECRKQYTEDVKALKEEVMVYKREVQIQIDLRIKEREARDANRS